MSKEPLSARAFTTEPGVAGSCRGGTYTASTGVTVKSILEADTYAMSPSSSKGGVDHGLTPQY